MRWSASPVLAELIQHLNGTGESLERLAYLIAERTRGFRLRRGPDDLSPRVRIFNTYGVTEATIDSTFFDGEVESIGSGPQVPIGRPIANTEVYVLDDHLNPVPIGVPGELYIGGAGVARGYLNRSRAHRRTLRPSPLQRPPRARLYRSGDLVRYRPDGNLEFLGRMDEQVKIRGFRIELGEVEATLAEHPAVRRSVVLAREQTRRQAPGSLLRRLGTRAEPTERVAGLHEGEGAGVHGALGLRWA